MQSVNVHEILKKSELGFVIFSVQREKYHGQISSYNN